jgi:two-component system, OmpR family, sensor histidine kinase KdpD
MDETGSTPADGPLPRRGQHRIYLGYAPGVGKTHAMLEEALERTRAGEDVVVGFLEPHSRPDTARLATGLERVPPLAVGYRGTSFDELDVDSVIARRPGWVLVDELAHVTTPGTPHEERWQGVEQVLSAGVGVLSTVNVQHVESLGDFIFQVTGTRATGTVPDRIVEDADEVVLVDISPDELIERLKHGEVYAGDDVGRALTHFFRRSTLAALRERAQILLADRAERRATAGGR